MQSFGSPEMNRWLHWNDTLIHLWLWQGDKIWTDLGLTFETTFGRSIGAGFANPFTTGPLSFPTPGTLVPVDCFDILLLQPHCAAADSCPKRPEINTPNHAAHGLWPKIHLKFDTVCQQRMCWEMLGDRSPFRQLFPVLVALRDRSKMVFPSAPSLVKKCLSSMLDRLTCSGYHTGRFMRHLTTLCVSQCMSFEHFVGWRVIQYGNECETCDQTWQCPLEAKLWAPQGQLFPQSPNYYAGLFCWVLCRTNLQLALQRIQFL